MDDPVLLSRLQFAITIMFHYIFPPMTIGLGVVLVALEGLWLKTKNDLYHKQAKFWTRIFGIIFALGVASGIVMEFQFGTNWADYSRCVGDIFGSPLAAEGIFAFFLESGFLAILLFGWDKVGPKMHFLSSCMVALGAHFSAIWIIVANSWMQTPAGYKLVEVNGKIQAHITSFYDVVFNPSTVDRLTHALAGCWLGATLVLSVSAWYILKKRFTGGSEKSFKVALVIGLIGVAGMGITGDSSAREVSIHQPAKFAAMEGVMESGAPQDLHLIGWMNPSTHEVTGISIPYLLTLLTHHDLDMSITGMNDIPQDERPPILPVFYSFHLMILIGGPVSGGPVGVEKRLALPEALAALVLRFLRTGPANSQPGGLGRSGTGAPAMDCVRNPENGTRRIPHPHRGGSPFLPGYVLYHLCPAAGPLPLSNHP